MQKHLPTFRNPEDSNPSIQVKNRLIIAIMAVFNFDGYSILENTVEILLLCAGRYLFLPLNIQNIFALRMSFIYIQSSITSNFFRETCSLAAVIIKMP